MQVSVQSGEGLERRMTVELPAAEINQEVESRLKDLSRTVRVDGFRPGKVPLKVLRSRYGSRLQREVFGEMIQTSFPAALAQEKLRLAGVPSRIERNLEQEGPEQPRFAYTAVFEVMPEIEVVSLAGYHIKRPSAEITEADVDEMVERLRQQRLTWNPVDRPAQEGDQVRLSFKGTMDGEGFAGAERDDMPLVLGSSGMIEGFEAGLLGAVAGEHRSLELRFPEGYRVERLAGKPVVFEVDLHEVAEPVIPELDAEFAKSFGVENGDLDQLRNDIRNNMQRELNQRIEAKVKRQALDVLLEAHKIDLPNSLVNQEIESLRAQTRQDVAGAGKMELPRDLFENQARRRVALGLILHEVIREVGLQVDQERVRNTIAEFATSYENPQEVVDYYHHNRQQRASVESKVLEDQVVDWVLEQVQVDDMPSSFADVTAGAE